MKKNSAGISGKDGHCRVAADDLEKFLAVFPPSFQEGLKHEAALHHLNISELVEIVCDLGREPSARFPAGEIVLSGKAVDYSDIDYIVKRVSSFGKDNRAGIASTLHRISVIRSRSGVPLGITARVGRAVFGVMDIMADILEAGKSILMLGFPGVGKTTLLREASRVLADNLHKRVVIVDTSNEIAGDGDIPHPGIGRARRMQVAEPSLQHSVMIEAVENHMPEVIVIDEISSEAETYAARTIAERGVALIATAHGNKLENLLQNPSLSDLVGGIESVTLSDEEAKRRRCRKAVLERRAQPTFDVIVEIRDRNTFAIHHNVAEVVDAVLRGAEAKPEIRVRTKQGVVITEAAVPVIPAIDSSKSSFEYSQDIPAPPPPGYEIKEGARIFPYGVSRNRLQHAIEGLEINAEIARKWSDSDLVLALKGQEKHHETIFAKIERSGLPVRFIRANTIAQIQSFLEQHFHVQNNDRKVMALKEAAEVSAEVLESGRPKDLCPQPASLRRLQSEKLRSLGLGARDAGAGDKRHVRVFRLEKKSELDAFPQ